MFDYCNFTFKQDYLTYKPLTEIGIPSYMEFFKNWNEKCFNSTTFKPEVSEIDKINIENEGAK